MYPYDILFQGLDLYVIFITIGVIAALVIVRILGDKNKFPTGLQNLILIGAVISVVVGYCFAVLFQGIYNAIASGKFQINGNTGSTFYGGLIGGVGMMLLIYFVGGKLILKNDDNRKYFIRFLQMGFCCVAIAHGFGRLGCLCAGCCYGRETDAWYGTWQYMYTAGGKEIWKKVVPIQLFESIFLFFIGSVMFYFAWKNKNYNPPIYLIGYGIWRFVIEYFRADDRGQTLLNLLTPSQLTAIIMILIGISYIIIPVLYKKIKLKEK